MCEPIGFAKQLLIIVTSSFKKPAVGPLYDHTGAYRNFRECPSDRPDHQNNSGDALADRPDHQNNSGDALADRPDHQINS